MKLLAAVGSLALAAAFLTVPAFAQSGPVQPICANCHEKQVTSIDMTMHGSKLDAQGSMCQACHGDASAHLQDPVKNKPANPFRKGTLASEQTAVCMTCHSGNRNLAFWTSGKHAINDVACSNCHSIHGKAPTATIGKFTTTFLPIQAEICSNCHQEIRAAINKPSHHPIIEGKIKCSDCHNPHGALTPAMVKQPTINDQCYSCHADKRGPYVFNHPPVEENCATCHNPHGAVHYKLLREHTPNLCQDCHEWSRHPGTIYGAGGGFVCPPGSGNDKVNYAACFGKEGQLNTGVSNRLVDRACLNCHNAIHGSNAPGNRGKYFTR
jgi:DmsE family decaheme c-type cytochrome